MSDRDTWFPIPTDILAAFGLLTRIPLPARWALPTDRGPKIAWAFPLVGAFFGVVMFVMIVTLGELTGLQPWVLATLAVAIPVIATGALHEDGFADTLDGLWGGWTKVQRLEIMKDSHIGVYGVVGLVLLLLLKVGLYANLAQYGFHGLWPIIGAMALSRAMMVPVMAYVPLARANGLSAQTGKPAPETVYIALGIAIVIALIFGAWLAIFAAAAAAWGMAKLAENKIGGQTGDILGATQQVAEISALLAIAAF